MVTTNTIIDFPERLPSTSGWARFKTWVLDKCIEYACCGTLQDYRDLECYRVDEEVRACIRAEMREHHSYGDSETCVGNTIDAVEKEMGYSLARTKKDVSEPPVTKPKRQRRRKGKARGSDDEKSSSNSDAESTGRQETGLEEDDSNATTSQASSDEPEGDTRAKIIPRFAAACVLHLRAKLGALPNNEANVLLVQRKYLEMCRKHNVRDVDTVLHQGFVMNAMFTESVLDDISASRRRLPKWIRFLEEVPETGSIPAAIC